MAGPAPELVFEIFGLEAWEFAIGNEDRTKLLFTLRDSRNFVAWYFLRKACRGPLDHVGTLQKR